MMHVYRWLSGVLFCLALNPALASAEVSCACAKLGCDPCSTQESIKFYTDKCGPDDSKLKSCSRPRCVPIESPTPACPVPPAANSGPRAPIVIQAASEETPFVPDPKAVGKVKVIQGSVSIVHKDGKETVLTKDTEILEEDTVKAGADGAALVNFEGGNKLHVHPDTSVAIKEYKDPKAESSRKVLLQLIKGKIRNQVEQKYNGKTSYYRIQTKAAVAGVRGTDFVVEHTEGADLETTIQTFKGRVVLSDLDETKSREIDRGEGASFKADPRDIKHGILSEVYKIDGEKLKSLDIDTRVDLLAKGKKVPKESAICKAPKGFFNQCSWTCTGNPAHESKCRGDLSGVACVRHRCNGNGTWAEETRLSAPEAPVECPATGFTVKDCDY
jgi:hypothetical protein